ncbi:protein L [Acinetobacter wuhouensis]|uniref:Protein L n=1 Tax=Acinetobacter wuhouensis TaxID=1879050 RepID=A0A4Q7ALQ7_9GAMM|nr:protein L [Acinetobacter wuhouensis]RZG48423.1 protein L [Acinetobacter wuhouensis]RZG74612.1 protein L [Acinetobacter wuhouensis]
MTGIFAGTKFKELIGSAFTTTYSPSITVEYSGIYKCINCGREITSNMHPDDDTFPPHNKSISCKDAKWKLHVITDTMDDNFKSVIG